jgi:DNA repair photolyase
MTVQVALEPLIAGWTDNRENLNELFSALADAGVRQVTAGYLFLRDGIRENLEASLGAAAKAITSAYARGPILRSDYLAAARYLPKRQRERCYASLMAMGAPYGISVRVSGLTNPDFATSSRASTTTRQRTLFSGV